MMKLSYRSFIFFVMAENTHGQLSEVKILQYLE